MRRKELEKLLLKTVADAIGVELNEAPHARKQARRVTRSRRPFRRSQNADRAAA